MTQSTEALAIVVACLLAHTRRMPRKERLSFLKDVRSQLGEWQNIVQSREGDAVLSPQMAGLVKAGATIDQVQKRVAERR